MLRRAVLALGSLILATFVGCEAWVYTHSADAPPVDDSDLASRWQPVPDAENGRAQLAAAAKALAWPEERVRKLRELHAAGAWDHALAQELIAPNERVLAAYDAALDSPIYRPARLDPPIPTQSDIEAMRDQSMGLIYVEELCTFRALDTGFSGAADDAIDRSLRCFRSGQRQASMEGARVTDAVLGVSTQNAALHTMRRILPHARPSAAQSRRWAAAIEALRIPDEAWHDVWAEDYRFMSELTAAAASAEPDGTLLRWLVPTAYAVHPNRSRARLAEAARALRAVAGRTCAEANVAAWPALPVGTRFGERGESLGVHAAIAAQMLAPNGVSDFLDTMTIDSWRKSAATRCFGETVTGVAQTMIALRAYGAAHGELPATLAELVPAYLPRVPADGYDGAPLRYSREKKLVWSVGDDLRDDGGRPPDDPKCCRAEPKWEIPF